MSCRKITFEKNPTVWNHHRGGWSFALGLLKPLCAPDGILCISAVEELICNEKIIDEPWIGFVHQVPRNNYPFYPDLERLVKSHHFLESLDSCNGIFVLSGYIKSFLMKNLPRRIPVVRLFYPITPFPDNKRFNWESFNDTKEKKILFIGEFLRDYQSFYDLSVPREYKKYLIKSADVNLDQLYDCEKQKYQLARNESVHLIDRVSDDDYDDLLSSSIVFLRLFDAPANTIVLECLSRGTPLLINKLPGIAEYLGSEYPLFYNSLDDASTILSSKPKLLQASKYLNSLNKTKFQSEHFVNCFVNSSIYRSLPLPSSQQRDAKQTHFPKVSLSVMICSYKRVYNLKRLLECFVQQDCQEDFEIILWNNNNETQQDVAEIVSLFKNDLTIRLIQSSENYFCIVRLAIPKLMRGDLLLICDDDVVPSKNYVSTFLTKFKQYGPRAVLCFRGHVFGQHSLNDEEPDRFWEDYEHMQFFDETKDDCQVCSVEFNTTCNNK